MNISNRKNFENWLSNVKKIKQVIKNVKPPVIGIKLGVANDLCELNFLSINKDFFNAIKFKMRVVDNVNKIT